MYNYYYPQAAACGSVILFTKNGNNISILTTERDAKVGVGRSNSAGGYYETKQFIDSGKKLQDGFHELYREFLEELASETDVDLQNKLSSIVTFDQFKYDSFTVAQGLKSEGSINVNNFFMIALEITKEQLSEIMKFERTDEQAGKIVIEIDLDSLQGLTQPDLFEKINKDHLSEYRNPDEALAVKELIYRLLR